MFALHADPYILHLIEAPALGLGGIFSESAFLLFMKHVVLHKCSNITRLEIFVVLFATTPRVCSKFMRIGTYEVVYVLYVID